MAVDLSQALMTGAIGTGEGYRKKMLEMEQERRSAIREQKEQAEKARKNALWKAGLQVGGTLLGTAAGAGIGALTGGAGIPIGMAIGSGLGSAVGSGLGMFKGGPTEQDIYGLGQGGQQVASGLAMQAMRDKYSQPEFGQEWADIGNKYYRY